MYNLLKDRKILLFGASGDLGRAMTRRFLEEGAEVLAGTHRHPERLEDLQREFPEHLSAFQVNVRDQESIDEAFATVRGKGPFYAMVYNVGITKDHPTLGMEEEDDCYKLYIKKTH